MQHTSVTERSEALSKHNLQYVDGRIEAKSEAVARMQNKTRQEMRATAIKEIDEIRASMTVGSKLRAALWSFELGEADRQLHQMLCDRPAKINRAEHEKYSRLSGIATLLRARRSAQRGL